MIYENWLHIDSMALRTFFCPPLQKNIETECLVVGGGFAGLHAALKLVDSGKQVVLLEKNTCGGSSSGKSGGFLTPESEEDLQGLKAKYGEKRASIIYNIPTQGVKLIIDTLQKNKFDCDFRKQDSLYLSIKKSHNKFILEEAKTRAELKLPYELLEEKELKKVHPGNGYLKGIRYPGSYGINSFSYCKEMKNLLLKKGVKIYEASEVVKIDGMTAKTHLGSVKANNIIICIDKMRKELNKEVSDKFYHLQTYLAVSEPLNEEEVKKLFPNGELMCWDTKLIYSHYRLVAGNRILLGGSSAFASYLPKSYHSPSIINVFINNLKNRFPQIADVDFTHYWAGLIDVSKDLTPVVDYDKNNRRIQYVMGCAGLPWAAYCGDYAARRIVDPEKTEDLSEFLRIDRKYFLPEFFQKIFGKVITFAISHLRELLRS